MTPSTWLASEWRPTCMARALQRRDRQRMLAAHASDMHSVLSQLSTPSRPLMPATCPPAPHRLPEGVLVDTMLGEVFRAFTQGRSP